MVIFLHQFTSPAQSIPMLFSERSDGTNTCTHTVIDPQKIRARWKSDEADGGEFAEKKRYSRNEMKKKKQQHCVVKISK